MRTPQLSIASVIVYGPALPTAQGEVNGVKYALQPGRECKISIAVPLPGRRNMLLPKHNQTGLEVKIGRVPLTSLGLMLLTGRRVEELCNKITGVAGSISLTAAALKPLLDDIEDNLTA